MNRIFKDILLLFTLRFLYLSPSLRPNKCSPTDFLHFPEKIMCTLPSLSLLISHYPISAGDLLLLPPFLQLLQNMLLISEDLKFGVSYEREHDMYVFLGLGYLI